MAVYTTLTKTEIESLLAHFNLAGLHDFQGSSSGVENTTYFLCLNSGARYVLTVFESFSAATLGPYIQLMIALGKHDLPVPAPCIDNTGAALQLVANKPALLFPRAPGQHIEIPSSPACHAIGATLARIHNVTEASANTLPAIINPCGLAWMQETLALVKHSLEQSDINLLRGQIALSADLELRRLPSAIIHGDLFRDNALMENGAITAIIDFYNAGRDILLLDLAITANDWCYSQNMPTCAENIEGLLSGYQLHRSLDPSENASWRDCLQVAAARLWLSRQKRVVLSRQGHKGAIKNPDEYKQLLLAHLGTAKTAPK